MTWTYDLGAGQLLGQRASQEDAYYFSRSSQLNQETEFVALVLADGAGGEASGQVASHVATAAVARNLRLERACVDAPEMLRKSVDRGNTAIKDSVRKNKDQSGMGCTLISAVVCSDRLHWASVGDSHLYLARASKLEKINEDHSYGGLMALMEKRGKPMQRNPAWPLNALVSALNGGPVSRVDCPEKGRTLKENDRILLASDGLDTVEDDAVREIIFEANTSAECVDALLKAVAKADSPRQDNTTVLVASVVVRKDVEPKVAIAETDSFENRILREYARGVGTIEI